MVEILALRLRRELLGTQVRDARAVRGGGLPRPVELPILTLIQSTAFISYRQDDSSSEAERLAETITAQFGEGSAFIDTSDIAPGEKWPERLRSALGEAAVVVAVMGPEWILARDEWGRRGIDNPEDWVFQEIQLALQFNKVLQGDT
jgi:hypothetical protein